MSYSDRITRTIKSKRLLNKVFVGLMCLLELILLGAIAYIIVEIAKGPGDKIYELIALGLLILWFGILAAYYAWAVYFYNINMGLTNESWARIREEIKYNPEAIREIPKHNPNINETLGLPKGTVRGSLALTLMMGGLAMTIVAIGMPETLDESTFLVDNFDFFKTAFLMMIAFYFGNKSLEMIGYKSRRMYGPGDAQSQNQDSESTPVPPGTDATTIKDILNPTCK